MRRILTALLLSLAATAAHATTFTYSYSGDGVTGSGTLTADLIAPGEYVAVSGTDVAAGGGVNGVLTLIVNPGTPDEAYSPSGYFIYDDLLLPDSNPAVTHGGWLFTNGAGGEVNIYSNGPADYIYYDNTGFNVPISIDPSMVPEPAAFALLTSGMAGLVCVRRRQA